MSPPVGLFDDAALFRVLVSRDAMIAKWGFDLSGLINARAATDAARGMSAVALSRALVAVSLAACSLHVYASSGGNYYSDLLPVTLLYLSTHLLWVFFLNQSVKYSGD